MSLLAARDSPPVADALKLTTYCVRAPAAGDGDACATDTPLSWLAGTTLYESDATGAGSGGRRNGERVGPLGGVGDAVEGDADVVAGVDDLAAEQEALARQAAGAEAAADRLVVVTSNTVRAAVAAEVVPLGNVTVIAFAARRQPARRREAHHILRPRPPAGDGEPCATVTFETSAPAGAGAASSTVAAASALKLRVYLQASPGHRMSPVSTRMVQSATGPSGSSSLARRARQIALAGPQHDVALAAEVAHDHAAAPDPGERAVAAVGDVPDACRARWPSCCGRRCGSGLWRSRAGAGSAGG